MSGDEGGEDGVDGNGGVPVARRHLLAGGAVAGTGLAGAVYLGGGLDGLLGPSLGETPGFGDAIAFDPSYAMELGAQSPDGTEFRVTGRFDGADHVVRFANGDTTVVSTVVGDARYLVTEDRCVAYPGAGARADASGAPADANEDPSSTALKRTGTTTIDDREVVVYELSAGAFEGTDEVLTYYVDRETRYLRRLELATGVVDYHSWGDVDPIEPPDMACTPAE